ncbi:MAG: AMP-binding protein [Gammaproteobacteria bacterium]|nr:MAG: AMP-binding protein [Gammaproteobacteria bacterium]
MNMQTLLDYVEKNAAEIPQQTWLRDRSGDQFTEWNWSDATSEIGAVAAWLEQRYGSSKTNIVLLSRNRAHWMLADLAIIGSGNVTVPMFTTLPASTAQYIIDFTDAQLLILGETDNWDAVQGVLPDGIEIITLPGVQIESPHTTWEGIVSECSGQRPEFKGEPDDLVSIVFTSGTTGVPKGVMQTHESMIVPMQRGLKPFGLRDNPRFLSYLPLSHIAERQLVEVMSVLFAGTVTFNESLATLLRDMASTKPNFFFGPPRVWEQLQQGILAKFGSQQALDDALAKDSDGVGLQVGSMLGLDDADYLLTAAAPTPPALIQWHEKLGLVLMEGFGQTEIMATALNTREHRKVGSIGCLVDDVELKITDEGELVFKAPGAAIGYYKMPEKSAESFVDGWVHTGDKGYVDADGFVYLTGRVKDYFKTIHGKFVAPPPIESSFSGNDWTEQLCLLGRGYSKTVIVCVLSDIARQQDRGVIEEALLEQAVKVNEKVEKHARIGAVIMTTEPWTIENEVLTPTMKIRREQVELRFGERAQELARKSAEKGEILLDWAG